jgi:hypothetical protein
MSDPALPADRLKRLTRAHRTRLMQLWRSAGWPSRDAIELDLLAEGLVAARHDAQGRESLQLTEAGIAWLAQARQQARRADSAHDRLADRVARMLMDAGRIVWRELPLRAVADPPGADPSGPGRRPDAPTPEWTGLAADTVPSRSTWRIARPDVFSIRHTTVEAYLHPIVHEVKVSRADLLSDLRHAAKRQSYQWLCSECHYVFPAGLADPSEVPEGFGVWLLHGDIASGRLELARAARHVSCQLPFAVWMSLARATPLHAEDLDEPPRQATLGDEPRMARDPSRDDSQEQGSDDAAAR